MTILQQDILKTLLYHQVFRYPMRAEEVFLYLPSNSITFEYFQRELDRAVDLRLLRKHQQYYSVDSHIEELVAGRVKKEIFARRRWKIARIVAHVIKRFPFVRGCFITGTLSKNVSTPDCDIDLFMVTLPNRLWIARTLLILFKKIFLFNSKKYFCVNYFVTEDALAIPEKNLFTAIEIATSKPLLEPKLHLQFLQRNDWISEYLPNWNIERAKLNDAMSNTSRFRTIFESILGWERINQLDNYLMRKWKTIWEHRYPEMSVDDRDFLFMVEKTRSKAHPPDSQNKILSNYTALCREYGLLA